jgi:hypothetical protein
MKLIVGASCYTLPIIRGIFDIHDVSGVIFIPVFRWMIFMIHVIIIITTVTRHHGQDGTRNVSSSRLVLTTRLPGRVVGVGGRNCCSYSPSPLSLFHGRESCVELKACVCAWLTDDLSVLMNSYSFSFLLILFSSLCIISAVSHCFQRPPSLECPAVLYLDILAFLCRVCAPWIWCPLLFLSCVFLPAFAQCVQLLVSWVPFSCLLSVA